ncbi:beta-glucosidase [Marinococcus luteus]|uniref:Beta-glucosidase n=1 Tax=Marinococcus luteus TaxID=1122204 RepID=A0A1H2QP41_9BACI|nr:glycoside hydrolase family 3 N-terminal domain-containing protein [Marinococcus luteus]SDW08932.1 beta-glucosidase [Marinococcus luteus]
MDRSTFKKAVKEQKQDAKRKVKALREEKKKRKPLTREEKKNLRKEDKTKLKQWKQDIKNTEDKKEKKAKKKGYKKYKKIRRRPYILMSLLLVILLIGGTFLNWYLSATAPLTDEQAGAAEESREVAEQMMEESIVMLKNDDILPLEDKKVNVFGTGSARPVFSGGGAGSIDDTKADGLFKALDDEGISYNSTLYNVYNNYEKEEVASTEDFEPSDPSLLQTLLPNAVGFLPYNPEEMPVSELPDDTLEEAVNYSDTAIYTISRVGSEAVDLSIEDTQLRKEEEETIAALNENFEHVIILANTFNAFEFGFIEEYENIDALLWVGGPGQYGTHAIARVLNGETSPSGKLPDTYAYNVESNPAIENTGDFEYVNENGEETGRHFVNNEEGIYVGYRYYETFLTDEEYEETTQFPFGYGLSYTEFDWNVEETNFTDNEISFDVNVTNTGDAAGKDVVQVYFSPPYSEGGLEKADTELGGYAKTSELDPGESEVVTVSFPVKDMAAYDQENEEAWVLEEGDYELNVSSHIRDIKESSTYTVEETAVYNEDGATGTPIQNRFEDAEGDLTYLSRANPEETYPESPAEDDLLIPDIVEETADYEHESTTEDTPPTDVDNDIMLEDLQGLDYNDPLWEDFLDQFTAEEMIKLAGDGGYWSVPVERLGIPETSMYDGPSTIKNFFDSWSSVAFPAGINVGSTWNKSLVENMGESMGQEANAYDVEAVYAPALNMHRTPLGGRNFEYYSEDPHLVGETGAAYIRGLESTDTTAVMKHFVGNDQETNRANNGLYVWSNEQALREIYLQPFETAVKEGEPHGAMSSFTRVGPTWSGGSDELLTGVLREEWGFEGFVITDAGIGPQGEHFDPLQAIHAGNDMMLAFPINLPTANKFEEELAEHLEEDETETVAGLRKAVHNICYYILQTNEMKKDDE